MVSRNNDFETPLMLAAAAGKEDMGVTLAKRFPECIPWSDKSGLDAASLVPVAKSPCKTLTHPPAHAFL